MQNLIKKLDGINLSHQQKKQLLDVMKEIGGSSTGGEKVPKIFINSNGSIEIFDYGIVVSEGKLDYKVFESIFGDYLKDIPDIFKEMEENPTEYTETKGFMTISDLYAKRANDSIVVTSNDWIRLYKFVKIDVYSGSLLYTFVTGDYCLKIRVPFDKTTVLFEFKTNG